MRQLLGQLNRENAELKQQLAYKQAELSQLKVELKNREKPVFIIDFDNALHAGTEEQVCQHTSLRITEVL